MQVAAVRCGGVDTLTARIIRFVGKITKSDY